MGPVRRRGEELRGGLLYLHVQIFAFSFFSEAKTLLPLQHSAFFFLISTVWGIWLPGKFGTMSSLPNHGFPLGVIASLCTCFRKLIWCLVVPLQPSLQVFIFILLSSFYWLRGDGGRVDGGQKNQRFAMEKCPVRW
ncbi:hypothetical protein B0T22DRAFT_62129 [Podospora appendiculata]|uniref:Uncharacterized protein n=1 Tax=Podospora appendiculata TaxID=314037 RepID=A0AAE0XIX8_9PEZI|nr:hypothetical protein B0T22DRAFT_62129 [Podospora appendiculata]